MQNKAMLTVQDGPSSQPTHFANITNNNLRFRYVLGVCVCLRHKLTQENTT